MAKPKRIDFSEFMLRFGFNAQGEEPSRGIRPTLIRSVPPPDWEQSIAQYFPDFRVMVEASRQNCPSAFSVYLQQWLQNLGIEPPPGVFTPIAYGKPGRKEDPNAIGIYVLWQVIGKPSLASTALAKEYYKERYAQAALDERKRMVDRLRRTVERRMKKFPDDD
jgi:hypothetical protein